MFTRSHNVVSHCLRHPEILNLLHSTRRADDIRAAMYSTSGYRQRNHKRYRHVIEVVSIKRTVSPIINGLYGRSYMRALICSDDNEELIAGNL